MYRTEQSEPLCPTELRGFRRQRLEDPSRGLTVAQAMTDAGDNDKVTLRNNFPKTSNSCVDSREQLLRKSCWSDLNS